jgi:hypothetical protein
MKGVCPELTQGTGAVGIFCTHRDLRRDGVIHGFLSTDKRYVSSRLRHRCSLIPDRRPFCVAFEIVDIPLPAFHMCALDAPLWTEWAYVAGVCVCGACPPLGRSRHISFTCPIIRPGDFRLHPRVRNKTQNCPGESTHVIAPYEDSDPGLYGLFLCDADVQRRHVGVCDRGEGEPEELPSRVGFCIRLPTIVDADSLMRFIRRAPTV